MRYSNIFFTLTLTLAAADAAYVQVPMACPGMKPQSEPSWKKDNKQLLVPLSDKARTGLLNEAVEEGLISAVGPRFANVFYDAAEVESTASIFGCAAVITKSTVCVVKCTVAEDKAACLRDCASLKDLCDCQKFFPGPIRTVVATVCSALPQTDFYESDPYAPYVEYQNTASNSIALQAVRGDITKSQISQLEELALSSKICPLSFSQCGSCPCCIGVCFSDDCMGHCL